MSEIYCDNPHMGSIILVKTHAPTCYSGIPHTVVIVLSHLDKKLMVNCQARVNPMPPQWLQRVRYTAELFTQLLLFILFTLVPLYCQPLQGHTAHFFSNIIQTPVQE